MAKYSSYFSAATTPRSASTEIQKLGCVGHLPGVPEEKHPLFFKETLQTAFRLENMTGSAISDEEEQPVSNPIHIAEYFFGRRH